MVKYKYDAWGNCKILTASGVEITDSNNIGVLNPFRYRSYYYDTETNLYFLKTRYYDPEVGRFITIDDLSYLDPDTINGLNLYAYCGNNPIMRVDPTGHVWWNPSSWDWQGMFNSVGNAFSTAGKWLNNNVLNPVGDFFANNWDIVLGAGLIVGAVILSGVTCGASTAISGLIIGAIAGGLFGSAFGALSAAATGGNILNGAFTGLIVGGFGGISAGSAALAAAGMSLINDKLSGKKANGDSLAKASIVALTAGVFAGTGGAFTKMVLNNTTDKFVIHFATSLYSFFFSSYNFISDTIINEIFLK